MVSAYFIHIKGNSCWIRIEVYSECLDNIGSIRDQVRTCCLIESQETTEFQSRQAKLLSTVQVERTIEGEIKTLVRNVITKEHTQMSSLREFTLLPILLLPTLSPQGQSLLGSFRTEQTWLSRLEEAKNRMKRGVFWARFAQACPSSAKDSCWDCCMLLAAGSFPAVFQGLHTYPFHSCPESGQFLFLKTIQLPVQSNSFPCGNGETADLHQLSLLGTMEVDLAETLPISGM